MECVFSFLFSKQVQREDRQGNRISEGKGNERDKWPRHRGEDKQNQWERKVSSDKGLHIWMNVAMCVTDQIETLKSPNSQNRQNFAKFMIWQSSCIFHTISMRSSIHLVQRADCHFPLEIHTLHWPYVLCQTETLSPTFSERVSWCMGLQPFCWFCSVYVCTMCHYIGQQTDKASAITGYFLHLGLPSSPLQVHVLSADLFLVPDWFLQSLQCCWDVFLHTLTQSLSSSAHTLLPQILFSMCFILFSFNRWHRVGIWDA